MSNSVTVRRQDGLALVIVDNPPVNAMSHAVRSGLLEAIVELDDDEDIKVIVIGARGREFIAGADIREMREPARTPLLGDVLTRIESCRKPVVASLHGAVLGGGFETALACHYRCATPDTRVGFPEVKLGLLPGAGGTVRLPRAVEVRTALDLMISGEPVDASRAQALGLFDRMLAPGDWIEGATAFARAGLASSMRPQRLRERAVVGAESLPSQFFSDYRNSLSRASRGVEAVERIIQCMEACVGLPFDAAYARSRELFEACRASVQSAALRHLFFAERDSRSAPQRTAAAPAVRHIAVVGAGTMGAGIAASCLMGGFEVTLIEREPGVLDAGAGRVQQVLEGAVRRGKLTAAARASVVLHPSSDLAAAAGADLIVEAVFESMAVKQEVFRSLDAVRKPGSLLATNTSTLDVDLIASAAARPQDVLGMHFFSPAHVMRLVEIVRGRATSPAALAAALEVSRRLGKIGVVVGNGFGFVGNRLLYAYGRENQLMMLEGAAPERIDRVLEEWGMAMGPNAVGDLAGLDVGYRVRRERADAPADPRYFRVADMLVEMGRHGRKNGRGFYEYEGTKGERRADPQLGALIRAEADRLGVRQRDIADAEIIERCLFALVNEGARVLEEGVAHSAADIDVIWVNGYGFPRLRGGPMFFADTVGLPAVLATIQRYEHDHGSMYWSSAPLLSRLAKEGRSFAQWQPSR